jgi:hypothetical protein
MEEQYENGSKSNGMGKLVLDKFVLGGTGEFF